MIMASFIHVATGHFLRQIVTASRVPSSDNDIDSHLLVCEFRLIHPNDHGRIVQSAAVDQAK
jgi:hypothetical protein